MERKQIGTLMGKPIYESDDPELRAAGESIVSIGPLGRHRQELEYCGLCNELIRRGDEWIDDACQCVKRGLR